LKFIRYSEIENEKEDIEDTIDEITESQDKIDNDYSLDSDNQNEDVTVISNPDELTMEQRIRKEKPSSRVRFPIGAD
jgi:hypothetical protein